MLGIDKNASHDLLEDPKLEAQFLFSLTLEKLSELFRTEAVKYHLD